MIITGVKISNVGGAMKKIVGKILRRATPDIRTLQLEQISNAFRNSGQPSAKWKPLWADTFQGKVPEKREAALAKATNSYAKARASGGNTDNALTRVLKAKAKATPAESYRKGGKPLNNFGHLKDSFFTKYAFVFENEGTAIIVVASPLLYAAWQHTGFKTKGPNFIPLTRKAMLRHVLHANPKGEGLEQGVDYIMAWKGVNVPARPIIDYSDPVNKAQIGDVIRRSIATKG